MTRTVHPVASFMWTRASEAIPDVPIQLAPNAGNGGHPVEPMCLRFVDPDGETHVYLFTEEGRQKLVETLTGGIILPS